MGRVFKLGDNINTDQIIPGRHNITTDPAYLGEHCLCELRPDFQREVSQGDIIVAGENFGCGSSREHAPIALKAAGIRCVVAKSFARIFYRNAINIGLPVLVSQEAHGGFGDDETGEVDLESGIIRNISRGKGFRSTPLAASARRIVEAGGIIPFLKKHSLGELA